MKNFVRVFIAIWYLVGWMLHVYLALFRPEVYRPFGTTALIPGFPRLWVDWVMPNIRSFALILVLFELTTGLALIYKGRVVKIGLILSLLFNLFLVQLGLAYPAASAWEDLLVNRLPNLVFILLQIPMLWSTFERSLPEVVTARFGHPANPKRSFD